MVRVRFVREKERDRWHKVSKDTRKKEKRKKKVRVSKANKKEKKKMYTSIDTTGMWRVGTYFWKKRGERGRGEMAT